jgi:hypothetical protein
MKKIKYIIAIIGLFAGLTACDKQMADMNTNPLALSTIPDEYLFTSAVHQTFGGVSYQLRFSSQYDHMYVTNSEDRAADGYQDFHSQDIYKEMFSVLYTGPLRYINEVLLMTSSTGEYPNPVRNAMAQIVAIINFARATDSWGDIPYFEGAQGSIGIKYPKYDKQELIYKDMMDRLKKAVDLLKSADPKDGFVGADPIYNNDLTKWVRFANSLRFRFAMKTRFKDAATSAKVISECMNEPLMELNSQNFELKHQESENSELYNPWYDLRKHQDFKVSEKLTEWLKSTSDPRLSVFVEPTSSGEYKGMPNGLNDHAFSLVDWGSYSNPNKILYSKSLSEYIMTASEIWFLRAEAALYGLTSEDAAQLYKQGITTNLQLWKVDSQLISDFLNTQPEATLNGSTSNKARQIGTQMWIAFIPNFDEAWTSIRRTGYPVIPQRTDAVVYSLGVTNGLLPKRFKYASNEYLNNSDNVDQAVIQQGPDKIDTPVWWDVVGN